MIMRRLAAGLVAALVVTTPAAADPPPDNDAFLAAKSSDGLQSRWRTVLLAECIGIHNDDMTRLLAIERRLGALGPFSIGWCIKNDHIPDAFIRTGREL